MGWKRAPFAMSAHSLHFITTGGVEQRLDVGKSLKYVRVCGTPYSLRDPFSQPASHCTHRYSRTVSAVIYRHGREGIIDDVGLPEDVVEEDGVRYSPETYPGDFEQNETEHSSDRYDASRSYSWDDVGEQGRRDPDAEHEQTVEEGSGEYPNRWQMFFNVRSSDV